MDFIIPFYMNSHNLTLYLASDAKRSYSFIILTIIFISFTLIQWKNHFHHPSLRHTVSLSCSLCRSVLLQLHLHNASSFSIPCTPQLFYFVGVNLLFSLFFFCSVFPIPILHFLDLWFYCTSTHFSYIFALNQFCKILEYSSYIVQQTSPYKLALIFSFPYFLQSLICLPILNILDISASVSLVTKYTF